MSLDQMRDPYVAKCDKEIKNKKDKTVYDAAKDCGHDEVADFLKQ